MLCDNCGKREANIRYTENINGKIKEMHLCEECSKKLGIMNKMDFNISTNFPSFFGSFLEDFEELNSMPIFNELKEKVCDSCNTSFEDIINTGKLGCPNCYDVFSDRLDPILKRLQGANRHVGRKAEQLNNDNKISKNSDDEKNKKEVKSTSKGSKEKINTASENNVQENEIEKLQEQLKEAIKEERYEDAAKIRDEINLMRKNQKN